MKRITLNDLSENSINRVLDELTQYQKELLRKRDELLRRIAEIGAAEAQARFGDGVTVEVMSLTKTQYAIVASGDVVCFLEFGTGELVDMGEKYADIMPFNVYPGSWSEEHAHTYQHWLESGVTGSYPYNTEPRRGMYHAYEEMYRRVEEIVKEVFGA